MNPPTGHPAAWSARRKLVLSRAILPHLTDDGAGPSAHPVPGPVDGRRASSVPFRRVGPSCGAAVFGVDALGFFELVLKDDDAAGGLDGGALVDEFPGPGRDAQLVPGVAAVAALRTERGDQPGLAEGAEELGVVPSIAAARPMV